VTADPSRRRAARRWLLLVIAWGVAGCGLFPDLGWLGASDAGSDVAAADAPFETDPGDAAGDAGDAAADADADAGYFLDDFNRADNAAIGNAWLMKRSTAFDLSTQTVRRLADGSGYTDAIVYRPAQEDVLDVRIQLELHENASSPGYPQVMVRVQSGTVSTSGALDAYVLYVNGGNTQAVIARQRGTTNVTLATLSLSPSLDTTNQFRFKFSATGTSPVVLQAEMDRWDVQNSTWVLIGAASYDDTAPSAITTAGSVGFSGNGSDTADNYRFDNFERFDL
jgi:hypothetical protein